MKLNYATIASILFVLASCKSLEGSRYSLSKKIPENVGINALFFENDSIAIMELKNGSIKFTYSKPHRNFLEVEEFHEENLKFPFEKGDSIVIFKQELYYFKDDHKLVFKRTKD